MEEEINFTVLNICKCGCGKRCNNIFISGHNAHWNAHICKCGCGLRCEGEYRYGHKSAINLCICGCNRLCRNKFIHGHNKGNQGAIGKVAWNRGMTKETNATVAKYSLTLKGQMKSAEAREKNRTSHLGKKFGPCSKEKRNKISMSNIGKTRTSAQKMKMSIAHIGLKQSDETIAKRLSHGWRRFPYIFLSGNILLMRSSWEVLYAKYLDSLGIKWQYEPKQFKLSNGKRYWPDFYLPDLNEYREVKGFMSIVAKEKIDLFQKEYPEFSFRLIMKNSLVDFGIL